MLITDGQVGNEDQILATLGPRLKDIRVFTLGIDQAVNEAFLRRLAERGGGACELVESEDRLDEVMAVGPSPDRHAAADRAVIWSRRAWRSSRARSCRRGCRTCSRARRS